MDKDRCSKKVFPNERWGAFHPHQCNRKIWKDGFCKQHHPETEEARYKKAESRWQKKRNNEPIFLLRKSLDKANARITELEAELKEARHG
jgi:hypothetical protein